MKIRAAVLNEMGRSQPYAQTRPVSIETVELDSPGPGEALATAYRITRRGGTTVTASLPNPAHHFALPAVRQVIVF